MKSPLASSHDSPCALGLVVVERGAVVEERSWLIDPAAHGGHREFDLAMMRLFGGFGEACFAAYGERFPLVFSGNHCQGAVFHDGTRFVNDAMLARFDGIAASMPEFWFGRFDVRFRDPARFVDGEGFRIVEINGAGAEATHIWDARMGLGEAYRTLREQYRILFEVGAANRRRGHRPVGVARFLRDVVAYRRAARGYPSTW